MQRVVVTGMGVVTPIGKSINEFWTSLVEGQTGTGPITLFDSEGFDSRVAAEVKDFDPRDYLYAKDARRTDRFIQFAVAASRAALDDASLAIDDG
ncbi:MAG: beta-ketoacyl synthase N-terminal-like domain-containing protein, partial [Nitrolancea sp.]